MLLLLVYQPMQLVYLLLGSNLGNRKANIGKAKQLIGDRVGAITQQSAMYETEAWGGIEQGAFLNQAIAVQTDLAPLDLLKTLKAIEVETGRTDTVRWGPRVIDIDIMLMNGLVLQTDVLTIPQKHLEARRFALTPLAEIAPKVVHPVLGVSIEELLAVCPDAGTVTKVNEEG